MKFQPKRFVVEVKRGTSRAAFSTPDTGLDKFGSAEAMLFGGTPPALAPSTQSKVKTKSQPPRRILESLIETPAPVVEEIVEKPRRGRKPGSKNKPKFAIPAASPPVAPVARSLSPAALAFMNGSGRPREMPNHLDHAPSPEHRAVEPTHPLEASELIAAESGKSRRPRLRDRSSILKRYVLGTEPKPGQSGALRARRLARGAAH